MKKLVLAAVLEALAAGCAAAGPMYAINFTGTMTSGTASGFDPSLSNNQLSQFADLTGMQVSGSLLFDLGTAPLPTVSTDVNGFTNTLIQSSGLPAFVSEQFTIDGFTVPAGFFPMPTTFDLPAIPNPAGSTVTPTQSIQLLQFGTRPVASVQSVLAEMNFASSWSGTLQGSNITSLDLLASSLTPFFPVPPTGSLPTSWGPETSGQNGIFHFFVLSEDTTVQANFGITAWWDVNGNFALDSVSGGLMTPEPGTLVLNAVIAALVYCGGQPRSIQSR